MNRPIDPRRANRRARLLIAVAIGSVVLVAMDVAPIAMAALAFAASLGAYLSARAGMRAGDRATPGDRGGRGTSGGR
ncbi:MAG: hypothetical protein JJT89_08995 [Nitriliruptoraceae bacterium]|nr:hypothetical protein [Nitriliruptoraceae bacterium]